MAVGNFCNDRKSALMLTSALIYMQKGISKTGYFWTTQKYHATEKIQKNTLRKVESKK